jgi:hypothetical protein
VVFESNPPGVTLELTVTGPEPKLVLLNSSLQQTTVSSPYTEWFAEVRNDGSSLACYTHADATFYNAAGGVVWETGGLGSFAKADAYDHPSSVSSVPCLAPGDIGLFYANEFGGSEFDPATVTRMKIDLESTAVDGAVPHPLAPTVAGVATVTNPDALLYPYTIQGTVTAVGTVQAVSASVFGRNPTTGFYDSYFPTSNPNVTMTAGESWTFTTMAFEAPLYTDIRVNVSFMEP